MHSIAILRNRIRTLLRRTGMPCNCREAPSIIATITTTTTQCQQRRLLLSEATTTITTNTDQQEEIPDDHDDHHHHHQKLVTNSSNTNTNSHVAQIIQDYRSKPPTNVSLQMLMKTGRGELLGKSYKTEAFLGRMGQRLATQRILMQFAAFLRKEIPIRLAHRIDDLEHVPILSQMQAVQDVRQIYVDSFMEMIHHAPIQTHHDEESFALMLEKLYKKHSGVLVQMAKGAYELKEGIKRGDIELPSTLTSAQQNEKDLLDANSKPTNNMSLLHAPPSATKSSEDEKLKDTTSNISSTLPTQQQQQHGDNNNNDITDDVLLFEHMNDFHEFLNRFYMSRIGIRVLAGQYLALRDKPHTDYIGMICQTTSPSDIVRKAAADASGICRRKYGRAAHIEITGRLDLTFPYIPTYLHYILLELLKNALRATAEHYQGQTVLPSVTVIIADGVENEDVVIKIADEGGGIPRSQIEKIWSYLYTTANSSLQEALFYGRDHSNISPIAGLGYGLPISRSYCRYFGGDIDLMSMDGHGTDVFVYLKRIGDSKEPMLV